MATKKRTNNPNRFEVTDKSKFGKAITTKEELLIVAKNKKSIILHLEDSNTRIPARAFIHRSFILVTQWLKEGRIFEYVTKD